MVGLAGCQAADAPEDAPDAGSNDGGAQTDQGSDCSDPVLTDGPATGGTVSISTDAMDPSTLNISIGDIVGFTSGDGGNHGLVIGTLSSVTVANGLDEFYRFDGPGICDATDELGSGVVTISVQ